MKKLLAIISFLSCLNCFGQTHLQITLTNIAGISVVTNRTIFIQPMSVPTVNQSSVVTGDISVFTTDVNGQVTISNMVTPMLYLCRVQAPPSQTTFLVYLPTNNLGLVNAASNLVASSSSTFPAGSVAWAAAASDLRYLSAFTITNVMLGGATGSTNIFITTNGVKQLVIAQTNLGVLPNQIIPKNAVYDNTGTYNLTVQSNAYVAYVIGNDFPNNNLTYLGVNINLPGVGIVGLFQTTNATFTLTGGSPGDNVFNEGNLLYNAPVQTMLGSFGGDFHGNFTGGTFTNDPSLGPAQFYGNFNGGNFNGVSYNNIIPSIAAQSTNFPINGFWPPHGDEMAHMMPVPAFIYSTYLQFGFAVTSTNITNMVNQLVAQNIPNTLALFGQQAWIELDAGWEQTNIIRTPGSLLNCNSNQFPGGIQGVATYCHANGVKLMLYSYPSQTPCGGTLGQLAGSPLGLLYGDLIRMYNVFGVDGFSGDICGLPPNESNQRKVYLETAQGVRDIVALNIADFNSGGRPFAVRAATAHAETPFYLWSPFESSNIQYDGQSYPDTSYFNDAKNFYQHLTNSWAIAPGHYYNNFNAFEQDGTNQLCLNMTFAAMLPSTPMITLVTGAGGPYYTNQEVLKVWLDAAVIPAFLATNNSAGSTWVRPLGSINGNVKAAVLLNTNVTSQTGFLDLTAAGFSKGTPVVIRDIWAHNTLGTFTNSYSTTLAATNLQFLTLTAGPIGDGSALTNLSGVAYLAQTNIFTSSNFFAGGTGLPSLSPSKILRTDANTNLNIVTVGSGLSFDGTTLSATGGGGAATNAWLNNGNGGISSATNFLGTIDAAPLIIKVNNTEIMRFTKAGSSLSIVGMGNTVPPSGDGIIMGGSLNTIGIGASGCFIGDGVGNTAGNQGSFVGSGQGNLAGGNYSVVDGGQTNTASGVCSWAGGTVAKVTHDGTFAWADRSTGLAFQSTAVNQFLIQATNGVGINTNNPSGMGLFVNGSAAVQNNLNVLGTITTNNLVPTVDEGVPGLVASVHSFGNAAQIGATSLYTPSTTNGVFRVSGCVSVTVAGTGTNQVQITFKGPGVAGGTTVPMMVQNITGTMQVTNSVALTGLGQFSLVPMIIQTTNSVIQYQTVSNIGGGAKYDLHLELEALNAK